MVGNAQGVKVAQAFSDQNFLRLNHHYFHFETTHQTVPFYRFYSSRVAMKAMFWTISKSTLPCLKNDDYNDDDLEFSIILSCFVGIAVVVFSTNLVCFLLKNRWQGPVAF